MSIRYVNVAVFMVWSLTYILRHINTAKKIQKIFTQFGT